MRDTSIKREYKIRHETKSVMHVIKMRESSAMEIHEKIERKYKAK